MAKEASKKDDKAQSKADKKADKKKAKAQLTPYQRAARNMYWFALTLAFGVVVYLCYEAYLLFISNVK